MKVLLAILAMVALSPWAVARTVGELMASEDAGIFVALPHDTRLDLLDYYAAGQRVAMDNNFGGKAQLDTVTPRYLRVTTSPSSHVELLMATSRRDTVVYVVTTWLLPAPDSRIEVYDTQWQRLETEKYIKLPQFTDFINASKQQRQELAGRVQVPTVQYSIDPTTATLTATPTMAQTMTIEAYEELRPHLKNNITYRLKGTKFKM